MGVFYDRRFHETIFFTRRKGKADQKEARSTLILFAICLIWHIGFAYGLSGRCDIHVAGLPLWWILSTPGVFVVGVIGLIYLLKKVFVNFELDDSSMTGGEDHGE